MQPVAQPHCAMCSTGFCPCTVAGTPCQPWGPVHAACSIWAESYIAQGSSLVWLAICPSDAHWAHGAGWIYPPGVVNSYLNLDLRICFFKEEENPVIRYKEHEYPLRSPAWEKKWYPLLSLTTAHPASNCQLAVPETSALWAQLLSSFQWSPIFSYLSFLYRFFPFKGPLQIPPACLQASSAVTLQSNAFWYTKESQEYPLQETPELSRAEEICQPPVLGACTWPTGLARNIQGLARRQAEMQHVFLWG